MCKSYKANQETERYQSNLCSKIALKNIENSRCKPEFDQKNYVTNRENVLYKSGFKKLFLKVVELDEIVKSPKVIAY